MVSGAAEKEIVGTGCPIVTVTCFWGGVPFAVVNALSVYVVVTTGLTFAEPLPGFDPTPLSIVTTFTDAPVVVHDSVDVAPDVTVVGLAVNEVMQPLPMSKLLEKVP